MVGLLSLSIALQVITRCEVEAHVERFAEGTQKTGHELSSAIRCGVVRDTMLGIDMHDEQEHELFRVNGVNGGDEDALLGEVVNNNEDSRKTAGEGQLFNEVHRYRIPRTQWCRKGFQEAIQFMLWGLTMLADDTRDAI